MAGIRAIVFAAFGTAVFMLFLIVAVGGFSITNNVQLPANLSNQYNIYTSNNIYSNSSAIAGISPLLQKTSANKNLTQNQTFISGTASAVAVTVGLIPSMITLWNTYVNFVGQGMGLIGINPSLAELVAVAMIITLIILTIVSALFLFPI